MHYKPDTTGQPPAYGATPVGNWLISLEGDLVWIERLEKIKDTSPQRYKVYIPYLCLEDANIFSILKFRLNLQIQIDGSKLEGNHETDSVRTLSCSNCDNGNKNEDVCIELEHKERKDNRITDEEMDYIRKLDKE